MVATAVLGKNFKALTSRDNVKESIKKRLASKLSENYVNEVITTITQVFEDSSKEGVVKKDALKDRMSAKLGDKKLFKFTQGTLEEMIEDFESRSIEIYIKEITKDSDEYKDFIDRTLNDTATVMERALSDQPMWGIFFKHGDDILLISPIIQLGELLWVPAVTCEIELNNGDKLAPIDISRMLIPVMEAAYTGKQDKGAVEVTGPKGGKYPCGQIYTNKKRDQLTPKEKKIELQNGYVLDLFVVKKSK